MGQIEAAALGQHPRARERRGQVGEAAGHGRGGAQVPGCAGPQVGAGAPQRHPLADADQHVLQVPVGAVRIVGIAGGHQRQAAAACQLGEGVGEAGVAGQAGALHLHPQVRGAEDLLEIVQGGACARVVAAGQRRGDRSLPAAGQALHPGGVGGHVGEAGARGALGARQVRRGEQGGQGAVALGVAGQQREVRGRHRGSARSRRWAGCPPPCRPWRAPRCPPGCRGRSGPGPGSPARPPWPPAPRACWPRPGG